MEGAPVMGAEEVRGFQLYMRQEKKLALGTVVPRFSAHLAIRCPSPRGILL
jgi:hypothetical protein